MGKSKFKKTANLINEIEEYIMKTSIKPRRELAICSALAIGAVCASKAKIKFNLGRIISYPNLILAMVADTGEGKDNPRRIVERIIGDNRINLLGSGDYRSAPSITNNMDDGISPWKGEKEPLDRVANHIRLDVSDEFIELFRRMNQKNAPAHQSAIQDVICKLFSSSGTIFQMGRYASIKNGPSQIQSPCVSYLGSATIEDCKKNFSKINVEKGILPRTLLFVSDDKVESIIDNPVDFDADSKLEFIIEKLKEHIDYYKALNGKDDLDWDWTNIAPPKETHAYLRLKKMMIWVISYFEKAKKEKPEEVVSLFYRGAELTFKIAIVIAFMNKDNYITDKTVRTAALMVGVTIENSFPIYNVIDENDYMQLEYEKFVKRIKYIAKNGNGLVGKKKLSGKSKKIRSNGHYERFLKMAFEDQLLRPNEKNKESWIHE